MFLLVAAERNKDLFNRSTMPDPVLMVVSMYIIYVIFVQQFVIFSLVLGLGVKHNMSFCYISVSEGEELLEAAADVAASMKGIEQTAFADLANQLSKLDSTVAERATNQSIITSS